MLPADFLQQADFGLPAPAHEAFLASLEGASPTSIRLNPFKMGEKPEGATPVAWESQGYYLPSRLSFTTEADFWAGKYYVQEASSMFVGEILRQTLPLEEDLTVLDMCAAPGGKSTHILSLLSPDSILVSNEVFRTRAYILSENIARWGQGNVILSLQNSAKMSGLTGTFDAVLVDAPCSGEGMFRKDKEARKEWSLANVHLCVERQQQILENIAPTLKENGVMIYSTCTFNTQENEQNLLPYLEEGWESIQLNVPEDWQIVCTETAHAGKVLYSYRFYPHLLAGEGFFISCLRKGYSEKKVKLYTKNPNLAPLPAKRADFLRSWVGKVEDFQYYQTTQQNVYALPAHQAEKMRAIAEYIGAWTTGYHIGTRKHDDLEPAPAWALAGKCPETLPTLDLPTEDALNFLRKQDISLPTPATKGWHLATYNGLGLGWLKALPNRWNNYYPTTWRIRHL